MFGSLSKPTRRGYVVLRHTLAVAVHSAKHVLCIGVALVGSLSIPTDCSGIILRNAVAVGVRVAEFVLSAAIALVGEQTPQPPRGRIVSAIRSR